MKNINLKNIKFLILNSLADCETDRFKTSLILNDDGKKQQKNIDQIRDFFELCQDQWPTKRQNAKDLMQKMNEKLSSINHRSKILSPNLKDRQAGWDEWFVDLGLVTLGNFREENKPTLLLTQYQHCSTGVACGTWQLLHYLSCCVDDQHVKKTIKTIVNFIGNFFHCGGCREDFRKRAGVDKTTNTDLAEGIFRPRPYKKISTSDELILWLWKTHNDVSEHLATNKGLSKPTDLFGDKPKIQFPTKASIESFDDESKDVCIQQPYKNPDTLDTTWFKASWKYTNLYNETSVLNYLKTIYDTDNISLTGRVQI